ncbi:bifunctional ADP-dependent NAD(P)H-hydrate dehydratase/NAD(P)H-hydrate epimerase [Leptolyngbya sp. PCC 6406]|uniref:bifunctional ADP-dependent NAD(P)H-hydrate dehydratase/NAD(P)H-hydrate epimerase n=1 Tax=Leptolyngbya sp. PCC 6406 TaxID=1173264 RepID=UPI0002AC09A9|nr:bifunctional ADP-dependent NAD(P)H-hydrate dehydratase/NAD(P)H-hydrate epimerase [Leptolyngbya sp. PCC 6406]
MPMTPSPLVQRAVVTAAQMEALEARLFAAGMPVAALMEKVADRIAQWIETHYSLAEFPTVGVLVGPGHNGGDALVVARELHHRGYGVHLAYLSDRLKDLTAAHSIYAQHLGIPRVQTVTDLEACQLIVDGGFGLGLTRPLMGDIAAMIEAVNRWSIPVVSIDLPSGLDTDRGLPLGATLRATHTLCLGLWKRGLLQDAALPWVGELALLPFDIPAADIAAVVGATPALQRLTAATAIAQLPLHRAPTVHKYQVGHLLLVVGSTRYGGAALLAGRGAIASGVGMLTLVVPESLRLTALAQLPEALVVGAAETATGAIATLPPTLDWSQYDAVACGPGMTLDSTVFEAVWTCDRALILDADGLNWLAQESAVKRLRDGQRPAPRDHRAAPTLLTPHPGEFRRLFPDLWQAATDPTAAAEAAARATQSLVLLKGARTVIAPGDGRVWINPDSTPALARGGSGDVLTGLVGGLAAQHLQGEFADSPNAALLAAALGGVWWHAQTGRAIADERSVLGANPSHLAAALLPSLALVQKGEG